MDKGDLWIVEHLVTTHSGKYVAVVNETLAAVGDAGEVESRALEIDPNKMPSVFRVPREEGTVCLL